MEVERELRGHEGDVLCVECAPTTAGALVPCILSGAEDGTARLWDVRADTGSSITMRVPGSCEVNAVQFGSSGGQDGEWRVFVGAGESLYCYDLRKPGCEGLDVLGEEEIFCRFPLHQDEINQISVSPNGAFLATADDAGYCTLYSLQLLDRLLQRSDAMVSTKPIARYHHCAQEDIMCNTVQFLNDRQVVTGGLDCTVAKWNYKRKQEVFRINLAEQQREIVNPQFIHSTDVLGSRMAVGTGNGSVYLVDHTLNTASEALITHTLEYVHQLAVSQVRLGRKSNQDLLLTSGNDQRITLWHLPSPPTTTAPTPVAPPPTKSKGKGKKKKKGGKKTKTPTPTPVASDIKTQAEEESEPIEQPEPTLQGDRTHTSKVNWMSMSGGEDRRFFVADQSAIIKVFHISAE